jgi:hypothetical protein
VDGADAGLEQRIASSHERGTGGDHVVDEQNPQPLTPSSSSKGRPLQALRPSVPGL